MTPLQCACMKGHSKIVWLLLENGGSKAVRTEVSFLALHTLLQWFTINAFLISEINASTVGYQYLKILVL